MEEAKKVLAELRAKMEEKRVLLNSSKFEAHSKTNEAKMARKKFKYELSEFKDLKKQYHDVIGSKSNDKEGE